MKWLCVCAVFLAACGGGGGSSNGGPSGPVPVAQNEGGVVIRLDRNADGVADLVTLDTTTFEITEALDGGAGGGSIDVTDLLKGTALDPAITEAVSNYLANSIDLASETQLELQDSKGNAVLVTVFE